MSRPYSTKPTHNVCVKRDNVWFTVGVAWPTKNGGLTLRLNPFFDLSKLEPGEHLMVFAKNERSQAAPERSTADVDDDVDDVFGDDPPQLGSPPYR